MLFLPLSFSKCFEEIAPHLLGRVGSHSLPPLYPDAHHVVPKLHCCFLRLKLSKQTGWCVHEIRRQTSSSKYFIRANTCSSVLGPRNFASGHERSVPTKGPPWCPQWVQHSSLSPSSLAKAPVHSLQGKGYPTPVPKPVATSRPVLRHVPLWESDKCSDFANHFEGFTDLDGWSSSIHSLLYAIKKHVLRA